MPTPRIAVKDNYAANKMLPTSASRTADQPHLAITGEDSTNTQYAPRRVSVRV